MVAYNIILVCQVQRLGLCICASYHLHDNTAMWELVKLGFKVAHLVLGGSGTGASESPSSVLGHPTDSLGGCDWQLPLGRCQSHRRQMGTWGSGGGVLSVLISSPYHLCPLYSSSTRVALLVTQVSPPPSSSSAACLLLPFPSRPGTLWTIRSGWAMPRGPSWPWPSTCSLWGTTRVTLTPAVLSCLLSSGLRDSEPKASWATWLQS